MEIIKKKKPLKWNVLRKGILSACFCAFTLSLFSQGISVKGRVTDNTGEPLAGVSIQVKGTTAGNITDINGDYTLNNLAADAVLVFSYVGFAPQEAPVAGKTTLDIVLLDATLGLEEVVVVAYGVQKKVSVTGAVASVQTRELKQSASANLSTALAGRLPGLTALQTSGQPGNDAVNLYLRGVGTTNGANPLILIDGVPRSNINILDPNEVASISILKDASATAVFGVRGANGVILITTRRGESGKAELSVSADFSAQQFTINPPRLHSWDFAELENQAFRNDGIAEENLPFTPYMIDMYRSGQDPVFYPDRYAFKEFTEKFAPQTRLNANMSGGTDDLKYFLNMGYIGQGGNFKSEPKSMLNYDPSFNMNRYNFRGNVDYDIVKNLKLSLNLASYLEKMNSPATELYGGDLEWLISDMLAKVVDMRPTDAGPLTVDGYGVPANAVIAQTGQDRGIYGDINRRGYRQETNTMLNSSLTLDWGLDFITQGLSTKFMMSYDSKARTVLEGRRGYDCYNFNVVRSANERSSYNVIRDNQDDAIRLSKTMNSYYYMNMQYSLNYARRFGLHDVTGMILVQRDNWERDNYAADLPFNMIGFSGRATYGYDYRYLAEVNIGYNGSEQFAPKNRFGFFPAFSAGWVVSNEAFLKDNEILTNLKLRASYGKVGNDKLGETRFLYLSSISENGGGWIPSLGYGRYISQGKTGNDELSWEVAEKQNYGVDLQLLNSLSLSVDVFNENREGILISRGTVPELQGVALGNLPKVNMGIVENKGYEIELTYAKQLNSDLSFTVRGNYAYNENKQKFMDEAMLDEDYAYRYRSTGFSIGQHFGYLIDYSNGNGYINTQEELDNLPAYNVGGTPRLGDFKYIDVNGDGTIDAKDQAPVGYATDVPRVTYGFSGSLNYRQVDVSFLFSGIAKSTVSYAGWRYSEQPVQHAWTQERYSNGEAIRYPALGNGSSIKANDFFLLDRSFLRLKTAEIGYTVPQRVFRSTGIDRVRVYVNGNNLWIHTKMPVKTIDPEQASAGRYPLTKMINVGLNVVF
ncbi:MAG: TonB-dependent receptor [Tannerella sp.]|jgi:TonB-linked SusC/RagA family outer membrane protein|nr:TonB-dependent receptor [Tannerella sp.]